MREMVGGRVHPYRQYHCDPCSYRVSLGDMQIGQSTGMFSAKTHKLVIG